MQLNAEDGGKRQFIMVQLQELCPEGSEAAKAGFENICEIGKERIRRAGDRIKSEVEARGDDTALDIGFRVFKVDDSNMKDVYSSPGDIKQSALCDLIACFDKNIPEGVIREITKRKPLRAVFCDSGFADSPSKMNVFEIFKHYMPESADDIRRRVKVI